MDDKANKPRIFLAAPSYGEQSFGSGRGLWKACRDSNSYAIGHAASSLLANGFNRLWCEALNLQAAGEDIEYFAMLHSDMQPEDFWLDTLIAEMEAHGLDMLGTVAPIKDHNGLTSIALDEYGEYWRPHCRLTMKEVFRLPETFTSDDLGKPLLLNTGCWVCKFDKRWNTKVHFEVKDRIVYSKASGGYEAEVESEDWFFSRLCHEQGLKLGCTRKVRLRHTGRMEWGNDEPWGQWDYDRALLCESSIETQYQAEEPALVYAEGTENG